MRGYGRYNQCLLIVMIVMHMSLRLIAASNIYIPSYDDRYEEDIRQARTIKNYFKEPDDGLNYAQYHYVGAHAAEKYVRFFPEYTLQDQPVPSLLAIGVRGLMLSTYNWSLGWSSILREGVSIVCSNPSKESTVFRKNGKPLYQTLHYEMNRIFNFLKENQQAIITILFDDYSDSRKMSRDIREIIMKNDYDPLLKPSNWPHAQQKGEWPTLGWMRKNNKRLVMFTQTHDQHTDVTWPTKYYFWENMYGSIDENMACTEEKEFVSNAIKNNRSLVSFKCYGSVAANSTARNSKQCFEYYFAKNLTISCQNRKFADGKIFNVYWADHIINAVNALIKDGKKTVFDYVNELNSQNGK
ncbi:MAG TPA: hypothetical protein VLB80_02545 [Candidatus Babeliales bacterium]|nr:hypothetical protein [Candidatus Babeliales bacterium]